MRKDSKALASILMSEKKSPNSLGGKITGEAEEYIVGDGPSGADESSDMFKTTWLLATICPAREVCGWVRFRLSTKPRNDHGLQKLLILQQFVRETR